MNIQRMSTKPLPGILADIETAAGRDAALDFAHRYGGARVYVPHGAACGLGSFPFLWLRRLR